MWIIAGRTCEVCKSKLSNGPYMFVGIALMKSAPCCRRYASQSLMPAILAMAYGSFVGSSVPVSNDSSWIGCGANFG